MQKKIAVITTGGTIGSILRSDSTSVDTSESRIAQEIEHARNRLGYSVEVISALNKNSEALHPTDWIKILTCIEQVDKSDADGIVVTHGTDTMAFSVAAASIFNKCWYKKICFTGAFLPPDHPSSDTSLNLLAALEFAVSDYATTGVYVAFRSAQDNSAANIIRGADIKPMAFDNEFFQSAYSNVVANYQPSAGISMVNSFNATEIPSLDNLQTINHENVGQAQTEIACISLYPGIDKQFLHNATRDRTVLVLEMYHSGTGPTDDLIQFLKDVSKDTVVLMGTFPKKYIDLPYSSTNEIKQAGAHIYADLQPHLLYTFALLSLSIGNSSQDIVKNLCAWEI